jgi:uncharacterized protein (DUF983 family)
MNPILYSVFKNKCPQCHKGDVFKYKHPFRKGFDAMYTHCSHCNLKYEKEPGFFYGAMYVSYALMVAVFVTLWVLNSWFFNLGSTGFILLVTTAIITMATIVYRASRLVWLNFFVRYKK